ncbi:DUF6705 family protein [Flavobacterium sp.]|uniref:DUF6705 family protein n=1 Tax=Flavobacterium sp. TaxID=239 RepID=UPI0025F3304A|nr:DUF6705 family protein [Flavobacterium sp.]
MKKTIYFALTILVTSCYAQTDVINIIDKDGTRNTDAYYQDQNNLLDSYEGTWVYTNGTTALKIVLIKKTQQYNGKYYEDLIIGEYQYIENGVEKINTLSDINIEYNNQRKHHIIGNSIIRNTSKPPCPTCGVNEKRLRLGFTEVDSGLFGRIIVRRITYNSQLAISINIRAEGNSTPWIEGQPEPPNDFIVHSGDYILIKQ